MSHTARVTQDADGRGSAHLHLMVRAARRSDSAALHDLMDTAIATLQAPFLAPAQVAASRAFMGLDTQLIDDGTYLVAERGDDIVGCGGWSRRATLYGGDASIVAREPELLDPARDAAKIRAMYTHPRVVRQGIGSLILSACEQAAASAGFKEVELMSTLSGEPLYMQAGYAPIERVEVIAGGVGVPFIRMRKRV